MKIYYFQSYHEKENVATANTMLLLSRLYAYSSDKFFRFLKSECFMISSIQRLYLDYRKSMLILFQMQRLHKRALG